MLLVNQIKNNNLLNWVIQFLKGMFVGSGAILPGVSGGALAAIFGLYEPIITFLADIKTDFLKNVLYFVPVGLGGLFGVFVLSTPIDYGLTNFPVQVLWGFMGIIIGTFPSLYRAAGKNGRESKHLFLAVATAILSFLFLFYADNLSLVELSKNVGSWILAGAIFALGFMTPGISSSNFLIYLDLYQPITEGIRMLDLSIIIPVGISGVFSLLLFSKLMRKLMDMAYASVFHIILGVVISSTAIIAPERALYSGFTTGDYFAVVIIFILGLIFGYWMGQLEERYT